MDERLQVQSVCALRGVHRLTLSDGRAVLDVPSALSLWAVGDTVRVVVTCASPPLDARAGLLVMQGTVYEDCADCTHVSFGGLLARFPHVDGCGVGSACSVALA